MSRPAVLSGSQVNVFYNHYSFGGRLAYTTNPAGAVSERYQYDAFGTPTILDHTGAVLARSNVGNRMLLMGQPYFPELGLYRQGARWLRPSWGAFLTPDPLGYADGSNRFAYVGGHPIMWVDPTGLAGVRLTDAGMGVMNAVDDDAESWRAERRRRIAAAREHKARTGEYPFERTDRLFTLGLAGNIGAIVTGAVGAGISGGSLILEGAIGGSLTGLQSQGLDDLYAGQLSSADAYAGSFVQGGAAGALGGGILKGLGWAGGKVLDGARGALRRFWPCACFIAGTAVATSAVADDFVAIDALRVGDRVQATSDGEAPTAVDDTWLAAELEMALPGDGGSVFIELLRPAAWFEAAGASEGERFWLTLDELGIDGPATVRALMPAPEIEPGPGRVVLATIRHARDDVLEVRFEDGRTPLYPTAAHLLYSADRDAWVRASEIRAGEWLRADDGTVQVQSVVPIEGTHSVFNIEVEHDHSYFVSEERVLAHNISPCWHRLLGSVLGDLSPSTPAVASKGPVHHLATNKNFISTARGGPWSPRFEAIFKKAGIGLDNAANKIRVPGHRGPHPQAYHDAVFQRLTSATEGLSGDAYKQSLLKELNALASEASTPGSLLNKLLTRK